MQRIAFVVGLTLAPRYRDNLLKLRGLRFDAGTADEFAHIPVTSKQLSDLLMV